ncbi:CLUMA_CG017678, isoform A [Clunio marinus]|uniref:CLUMA_CG017678, isoform A n=1 Tax=Clunio marinus TaxID=568069 RepID=A0A1J1IY17_9DIPT|nr:CLUMA_CG017678, isoform A [Clunio marinus]
MKFALIALIVFCAAVTFGASDPVEFSNNNIHDIINIDAQANLVLSSAVELDIVSLIAGLMNQQAVVAASGGAMPMAEPASESE